MIMRITLITLFQFLFMGSGVSQINNIHLNIGEKAPKIIGKDQFGNAINSYDLNKSKKILVIFYRGNWCPYCNKHIKSLNNHLEALEQKGLKVILITPESDLKIIETAKKVKPSISILHDKNDELMKKYKVAFNVTKENVPKYFEFTLNKVKAYNDENDLVLPVPATYLIGKNHLIEYVQYNPDYKIRSNFDEILSFLNKSNVKIVKEN